MAILSVHVLISWIACLAVARHSPSCSEGSTCAVHTDLLSAITDHSSSDHLAYVQMKVAKVHSARWEEDEGLRLRSPDDEPNVGSSVVDAAMQQHDSQTPVKNYESYSPPAASEFDDGYAAMEEREVQQVASSFAPISWAYVPKGNAAKGPWQWGEIPGYEECGAGLQSPINAQWKNLKVHPTLSAKDLILTKLATDCNMTTEYLLNERTAEMLYPGTCGKTFVATWKEKNYFLSQFHYHAPSEHTYDGGYYPMEVHHVHKADDGRTLIIAVMIASLTADERESSQDKIAEDFMQKFLDHVPHPSDQSNNRWSTMFESEMWDPYLDFLAGHLGNGFIHYVGSLDKPPCTKGTVWILDPFPITVEYTHIRNFRKLINSDPNNQLAPFGTIQQMGPHVVPTWAENAGMVHSPWDRDLHCNIRPIQRIDGRTIWAINQTIQSLTTVPPRAGEG